MTAKFRKESVAGMADVMQRVKMALPSTRVDLDVPTVDQRTALMDKYASELEAANGPVSAEELLDAMREWPDFHEE